MGIDDGGDLTRFRGYVVTFELGGEYLILNGWFTEMVPWIKKVVFLVLTKSNDLYKVASREAL